MVCGAQASSSSAVSYPNILTSAGLANRTFPPGAAMEKPMGALIRASRRCSSSPGPDSPEMQRPSDGKEGIRDSQVMG